MERAAQITRAEHGWSTLQSAFTTPKFSASVGDALIARWMSPAPGATCAIGSLSELLTNFKVYFAAGNCFLPI
jgi:hypothetical protein